jgi:hypothetical protein
MITLTPEQIKRIELATAVGDALADNAAVRHTLEALDMQPTSQAFELAAGSAVAVLIAHDLGYSNDEVAHKTRPAITVSLNGNGRQPKGRTQKKRASPKAKHREGGVQKGYKHPKQPCPVCQKPVASSRMVGHLKKKHPEFKPQEIPAPGAPS